MNDVLIASLDKKSPHGTNLHTLVIAEKSQ